MGKNTKGAYKIGNQMVYDYLKNNPDGTSKGVRKNSCGHINFDVKNTGRSLSLQLNGSGSNMIRVRKVWAEVVEVLKANGYAVGRRERDL